MFFSDKVRRLFFHCSGALSTPTVSNCPDQPETIIIRNPPLQLYPPAKGFSCLCWRSALSVTALDLGSGFWERSLHAPCSLGALCTLGVGSCAVPGLALTLTLTSTLLLTHSCQHSLIEKRYKPKILNPNLFFLCYLAFTIRDYLLLLPWRNCETNLIDVSKNQSCETCDGDLPIEKCK